MRKTGVKLFAFAFLFMFAISFVSAADFSSQVSGVIDGIVSVLKPVLTYTIGDPGGDSSVFLVKTLLFVLMLSIVFVAVGQVPLIGDSSGLKWLTAIIVGIFGARLLSTESFINAVWLPSGVTAISLVCILPFLIFFFFIESFKGQKIIRRVGWALYIVMFVTLAAVRWDDLASSQSGWNYGWIYIATAGLAFLSLIFDGTIQKLWARSAADRAAAGAASEAIIKLRRDLVQSHEDFAKGVITKTEYDKKVKSISGQIATLSKSL